MNFDTQNEFSMKHLKEYSIGLIMICIVGFSGCGAARDTTVEGPDQIVLTWTGDPATTQTISWHGETKYEGFVLCDGKQFSAKAVEIQRGSDYRYSAELTGLLAGQTYAYRVGDGSTWSEEHSFSTEKSGDFTFMYLGDIQYEKMARDYKKWGGFIEKAYEQNPAISFVLLGGDLVVETWALEEYEAVLDYGQAMFDSIPMMATPGNHETDITPILYKELFALPQNGTNQTKEEVYSFDYSNCHIISLNSNLFLPERIESMGKKKWNAMMDRVNEWLAQDLNETEASWIVVVMHHPPYPVAENIDLYGMIEDAWVPIFEEHGVDLVFVGHQHVYMRTKPINGVTYIMSRSGEKYSRYYKSGDPIPKYVEVLEEINTYQIISVKSDTLMLESYDSKGRIIDFWEKQE